jgi:hypothetical protein
MNGFRSALFWLALVFPAVVGSQQRGVSPAASAATGTVTARVVDAANGFLATLSASERTKGTFGFMSSQRTGWSNLPSGIFQRSGLRFGDMTARQRSSSWPLL